TILIFILLSSCTLPELNNITADEEETKSKDYELAENLRQRAVPQDDRVHFGGTISREHEKEGDALGWRATVSVRVGWPRVLPTPCSTCWTDNAGTQHHGLNGQMDYKPLRKENE